MTADMMSGDTPNKKLTKVSAPCVRNLVLHEDRVQFRSNSLV